MWGVWFLGQIECYTIEHPWIINEIDTLLFRNVPKEMCHLTLGNPHTDKKPMRLRWCTKHKPEKLSVPLYKPSKPSYLPPPPTRGSVPTSLRPAPASTTYRPNFQPTGNEFSPPSFSSPTGRPAIQFQRRSQQPVFETKFKPKIPIKFDVTEVDNPSNILIEDFFVQNSEEDLELITKNHAQLLTQTQPITVAQTEQSQKIIEERVEIHQSEQQPEKQLPHHEPIQEQKSETMPKPKSPDVKKKLSEKFPEKFPPKKSINIPPVLSASFSDDLTGFGSYSNAGMGESFL